MLLKPTVGGVCEHAVAAGEQRKRSTRSMCGAGLPRAGCPTSCGAGLLPKHALMGLCTSVPLAAAPRGGAAVAGVHVPPLRIQAELRTLLDTGEMALSSAWSSERFAVERSSTRSSLSIRRLRKPGVEPGVVVNLFSLPAALALRTLRGGMLFTGVGVTPRPRCCWDSETFARSSPSGTGMLECTVCGSGLVKATDRSKDFECVRELKPLHSIRVRTLFYEGVRQAVDSCIFRAAGGRV